jgi:uncharacterized membrane protein YbhN (UPF0104 family)
MRLDRITALTSRRGLMAAGGALAVTAGLAIVIATKGDAFSTALGSASPGILAVAVGLELLWILARCEAWAVCVDAAGGAVERRTLFRAASLGYLGNVLNPQFGLAVRIAALRRSAPAESPKATVLAAAELPIVIIEAGLAALMSFTLVGALGIAWWIPVAALAVMAAVTILTVRFAEHHRDRAWRGLAVMTGLRSRTRIIGLVVVAVSLQVLRNWFILHALGADTSIFDSIALLIGMAAIGLLPVGPGLGAATAVLILGSHGMATMAAAGALLTATAITGSAIFAAWAFLDRLRPGDAVAPAPAALPPAL